jgi:transcription termination factor NusA
MEFRKTLQQIDGINKEMATRLVGKGFDSLEKLVDASNEELADITGLTEKAIEDILEQARHMQENLRVEEESLSELTGDASKLKTEVERLILNIRNRFDDSNAPKEHVKELRKEISRTLASLERVEAALSDQLRRLSKSLAKADEKISKVSGLGVEEVMSGLKKARKNIEKAVD